VSWRRATVYRGVVAYKAGTACCGQRSAPVCGAGGSVAPLHDTLTTLRARGNDNWQWFCFASGDCWL